MDFGNAKTVPSSTITRTKIDLGADSQTSERTCGQVTPSEDHPVLQKAIQILRKHLQRAIEDKRYGSVGVSISLEAGTPLRIQDSVSGTEK